MNNKTHTQTTNIPYPSITLHNKPVGYGHCCFIIAEVGVNHNGDVAMARQLIDVAVQGGADAVKFQTFAARRLVSPDAPRADYQLRTTDAHESHYAMLKRLELSQSAHEELMAYAHQKGILFLSTPFDEIAADMLENLGVEAFKISSGELTNLPLLEHIARKQRPMIVSTGMSSLGEVDEAVQTIERAGNPPLVLLHCVSNYPATPEHANLRAMQTMASAFQLPIGYSDHTPGIEVALAAAALGACIIEKHVTLNKALPGPDHQASLEPHEFFAMVQGIRTVESALGNGRKQPASGEAHTASVARKSLVAAQTIPAGTQITRQHILVQRPGTGLPPVMLPYVVGHIAKVDIAEGALLNLDMLQ